MLDNPATHDKYTSYFDPITRPLYILMSLVTQIEDGTGKVDGDVGVLKQLDAAMVDFETGFRVLPGIKGKASKDDLNDFEVGPVAPPAE